jgi:hypothetical protein
MPTERERVMRLTLNLRRDLYDEIAALASENHLNVATCARMLLAEALRVRRFYRVHTLPPPVPRPPSKPRRR